MKKILLGLCLTLLMMSSAWAKDINPINLGGGYMWDIAGVITATGNSDTMVGSLNCDTYTAFIKASGTVSITAAFTVGDEAGSNNVTIKTYSLTSATTTGYTWSFPTPRMYIVFTVTTGQIDDAKVYCKER